MKPSRRAVLLMTGAAVGLLTSCAVTQQPAAAPAQGAPTASTAPGRPGQSTPTGTPRTVASGLAVPWSVVFREDGTPLVSERDSGRVLELAEDGSARPVGTVGGVEAVGEGGLLGLALDDRDRLYAYSTTAEGNRVQRFPLAGSAGSLSLGEPETLLDGLPSASYHNGGRIAFGPDGLLYVTAGDAGQPGRAQDLGSLGGKILRITPDGDVPADNPFPGSPVYSYGHRNPQGLTWAEDGTMFASEFGQNTWDELNIITPGANYGWPEVEGIGGDEDFTDPVQQWEPGEASPSGITHLDGTVVVANLRGAVLRAVPVADPTTSTELYPDTYGRLRDVTVAPDGRLWLVTSNTDGRGQPGPDDDRILSVDLGRG